jgi:hypothetical protein
MTDKPRQTNEIYQQAPKFLLRSVSRRVLLLGLALLMTLGLMGCGALPERQQDSVFPSPVTFVTAGPLPEASPTVTLPPLEKPTDVPATAAPKKLPLESTAAIGLWSDQITNTKTFTGVEDLMAGPAAVELAKTNLALVSLAKKQVYQGYGATITDVVANHHTWVLYDKNGKVAYAQTGNQEPLLNIGDIDVKNALADDVGKTVQDGSYDGIVLDGVGAELIRSTASPVFTGTKTYTEKQRRDAVEGLIRAVRAKIPSKLLIIGGYAWKDGTAYDARSSESQDLANLADGIHIDEFLRAPISSTTEFKSETNWKKDVDFLAAASQDNKIVLITTRIYGSDATADTIVGWLKYSVASYLLGKNGTHTYFQFDVQGAQEYATNQILSAPVGSPQEAYTKLSSGIYRRQFSNGIVLVNPTGDKKDTPLDGQYHMLGGTEQIDKLTLLPHTGEILLITK